MLDQLFHLLHNWITVWCSLHRLGSPKVLRGVHPVEPHSSFSTFFMAESSTSLVSTTASVQSKKNFYRTLEAHAHLQTQPGEVLMCTRSLRVASASRYHLPRLYQCWSMSLDVLKCVSVLDLSNYYSIYFSSLLFCSMRKIAPEWKLPNHLWFRSEPRVESFSIILYIM